MNAGEIHVWSASTDQVRASSAAGRFESWLSEDERERYQRLRRAEDRELYLFTRATLREALSNVADVAPEEWRFVAGPAGRPELDAPFDALGLRFNLSHTPGLVACLVSDAVDAGLDVERVGRALDVSTIAAMVCSPAEREELKVLAPAAAEARFYELWTLKEAYVKARGTGSELPLNKLTFTDGGRDRIAVRFSAPVEDDPDQWQFALWRPSPDHQGALAVRRGTGRDRKLVFHHAFAQLAR